MSTPMVPEPLRKICRTGVYFVKNGNKVKIGRSLDFQQRLRNLSTAASGKLLLVGFVQLKTAVEQGVIESRLHRHFSDHRVHGEWFKAEPVLAWLSEMNLDSQPYFVAAKAHALALVADESSVSPDTKVRAGEPSAATRERGKEARVLLSILDAAYLLGISRSTMFRLMGDGSISYVRIARRRMVSRSALDEFIEANTVAPRSRRRGNTL